MRGLVRLLSLLTFISAAERGVRACDVACRDCGRGGSSGPEHADLVEGTEEARAEETVEGWQALRLWMWD